MLFFLFHIYVEILFYTLLSIKTDRHSLLDRLRYWPESSSMIQYLQFTLLFRSIYCFKIDRISSFCACKHSHRYGRPDNQIVCQSDIYIGACFVIYSFFLFLRQIVLRKRICDYCALLVYFLFRSLINENKK